MIRKSSDETVIPLHGEFMLNVMIEELSFKKGKVDRMR